MAESPEKSSDTSATSSIDDDDEVTAAKASLDTILDANSRPSIAIRPEAMDWSDNLCGMDPLLSNSPGKKITKLDHGNLPSEGSHSKPACRDQPIEGSVHCPGGHGQLVTGQSGHFNEDYSYC